MSRSRIVLSSFARRSSAAVGAALIVVLALAGCESGNQEPDAPAGEPAELGAIEMPAAEPSGAAASAGATGPGGIAADRFPPELPENAEAAIPSNFPSSLPVYPNATPALGMSGNVEGSERSAVQLLSNDPPEQVARFYADELEANGWEIQASESGERGDSITATNGSTTTVIFFSPSADGGTDIYQLNEGGV